MLYLPSLLCCVNYQSTSTTKYVTQPSCNSRSQPGYAQHDTDSKAMNLPTALTNIVLSTSLYLVILIFGKVLTHTKPEQMYFLDTPDFFQLIGK